MTDHPAPPSSTTSSAWSRDHAVQVVRIRVADARPAPQPDPLGRTHVGYAEGITPDALWERARGVWKAKLATLAECALAVIVHNGVVVGVGTVESIAPHGDRVAIDGRPLANHPLIGSPDPLHNTSRNPITYGSITTVLPIAPPSRAYGKVLAEAIAVLTEAGRLRRSVMRPIEGAPAGNLRESRWEIDPDRTEPSDWAEFVSLALAGATANLGGIDTALAGRSGSWEAAGVRNLVESTVGADESDLWRHRTEPLHLTLFVEDLIMERTNVWADYDAAQRTIQQMYSEAESADPPIDPSPYLWQYRRTLTGQGDDARVGPWESIEPTGPAWTIEGWRSANIFDDEEAARYWERVLLGEETALGGDLAISESYLPKTPELGREYDRLVAERDARLDRLADLEEKLEEQRLREVAAYGQALKDHIETAARALPGLTVPVQVDVDQTWPSGSGHREGWSGSDIIERVVDRAIAETPTPENLPGTPLSRLLEAQDIDTNHYGEERE